MKVTEVPLYVAIHRVRENVRMLMEEGHQFERIKIAKAKNGLSSDNWWMIRNNRNYLTSQVRQQYLDNKGFYNTLVRDVSGEWVQADYLEDIHEDIVCLAWVNYRKNPKLIGPVVEIGLLEGFICRLKRHVEDVQCSPDIEFDHVVAKSKGGIDDPSNRVILCGNHNRHKKDLTIDEVLRRQQNL